MVTTNPPTNINDSANLGPSVDARITGKVTLDGRPYLAIDGKGLMAFFAMRKVWRLRAELRDGRIVFTGGKTGEHSIDARAAISSADRVLAHWRGYVENNDRAIFRR